MLGRILFSPPFTPHLLFKTHKHWAISQGRVQGSCGLLCQALPSAGHQLPHLQNVREPHRWLLQSRPLPLSSMAYFVSGSRLPVLHPYSWDSNGPPSDVQGTEGEKVLLFQCAVDQMTLM